MYHVEELSSVGLKREYRVSLSLEDLRQRFEEELKNTSSQAQIRGFRPGKVPPNHIRRLYGRSIMSSLVEQMLSESVQSTIKDKGLRPASPPTISQTESFGDLETLMAQGNANPLSYVFSLEVLPSIELKSLTDSFAREECPISEEEITEVLSRMMERQHGFSQIDSPEDWAKPEDYAVTISSSGTVDGEPDNFFEKENLTLFPARARLFSWDPEESLFPGFAPKLIGLNPGEERMIELSLTPEQAEKFPTLRSYVGKKVVIKVKTQKVEKRNTVEVNDEFARSLGLESLEALKNDIRQRLEKDSQDLARERLKHQIFKALNHLYNFEVPTYLIDQDARQVGTELQEYAGSQQEASVLLSDTSKQRKLAEQRVRLSLVLAEIGAQAQIHVTDTEIMQFLFAMSGHRLSPNDIVAQCRKHPHLAHGARASLFEDKVLDHLIAQVASETKTVSRQELMLSLEAPFEEFLLTPAHTEESFSEETRVEEGEKSPEAALENA
jgi:trigger factor